MRCVLHDLGLFDDALDLLDHEGAHAHCPGGSVIQIRAMRREKGGARLTLFADERVVTVIRIVGVTGHRTATVTEHSEVKLCKSPA
jgi:hypothetical protein